MQKVNTDGEKIKELLSRGVEEVFIKDDLEKELLSGKELRVKLGIDPTSTKIHLGRAIPLRKLRAFQNLGHKVVFIVGDFTAQVGDPSDKLEKRPMLTRAQIDEFMKDYKAQVGKIINLENAEFVYNGDWLKRLGFQEIGELAESFTVQQMLARRNFKERLDKGVEISLRELLYPLMQGYDSVAVEADVELGGFDQLFNLKAGRVIQEHYGKKPQNILITQMIEGIDGRKMSSSWGNIISIVDEPADMFGKIMALEDSLIIKYFTLCTEVSLDEIKTIENGIKNGDNPRDVKMRLATEIVRLYHNEKEAELAKNVFVKVFQEKQIPETMHEVKLGDGETLVDALVREGLVASKSYWHRLITEGAVKINGEETVDDPKFKPGGECVLKIGKRRFARIIP